MSTPERSPLALAGELPDPEVLVGDILTAVTVGGDALGPEQVDTDVSGLNAPCIRCYVPPGRRQLGKYGDLDTSFVYVGAWALDRTTAQDMLRQARNLLEPFREGGIHCGVAIFRCVESTGPTQLQQQPDAPDELVEGGWSIQLRRHRGPTVPG